MNAQLRTDLIEVFHEALVTVSPGRLINKSVSVNTGKLLIGSQEIALLEGARIWVFGAGKAAVAMASGLENVLGDLIHDGLIIVPEKRKDATRRVQQLTGAHPIPDENSLAATLELIELARHVAPGDIVIFLISGGSSALFEFPAGEIDLNDLVQMNQLLLTSGADISEINTVRKHISSVKGGQFLYNLRYARIYNLILSDVPGDAFTDIGSGPTNPDPTTFEDVWKVLAKYNLEDQLPKSVADWLKKGRDGLLPDTPKPGETLQCTIDNHLIGSSADLAEEVKKKLRERGYSARGSRKSYSKRIEDAVETVYKDVCKIYVNKKNQKKPVALVYHGESYVNVTGDGKGGRNTEFALRMAEKIAGMEDIVFLSGATDGIDGNTNAAGAICSGKTALLGEESGMTISHYISANDSWSYLKSLGLVLHTGPTGNNLMDLQIALIGNS